ncbi:MAG: hypothetical protein FWF56_05290 [Firmicutes bacterium]|nr:hypothetical protein [Bacillota bacterium]MCL1954119.1 hypothetical protein [Bacillota bacterium]
MEFDNNIDKQKLKRMVHWIKTLANENVKTGEHSSTTMINKFMDIIKREIDNDN